MKLKTIIFECPPLPALGIYQAALGVVDGVSSPYAPNYDPEFGLESSTYPIFLADGRIQLKINPKKYTRITEFSGGDPAFKDFWNGAYREVRLGRVGFEVTVVDIRAPLRLLFERIASIQASTVFQDGQYQTIKCWDSVHFEPEAFENGSKVTERDGAIMPITGSDGDGLYGPTQRNRCGIVGPVPDLLYSQGFTLRFMEATPRLLR
ncbi:MAG: hypothetical protein ACRC8Y_09350 [Chroococcales cyanobacterium]